MTKEIARDAKPTAGNPHVTPSQCYGGTCRFDEGKVARCGLAALLVTVLCAMVAAADSTDSAFLLPSSNVMWRTAPAATFEVPVFMPPGASSATLVVSGRKYRSEYTGLADGMFSLSLPAVDSDNTENVYDLTLAFNDDAATTRNARIAVVCGASSGGSVEAYVRTPGTYKWQTAAAKALLPIPAGVDALSVNGVTMDMGLYGNAGWYLLPVQARTDYNLLLTGDGNPLAQATLRGVSNFFCINFK